MKFFKKIQTLNVFWKKVIIFSVIIGLGIPLVFLIGKNFQRRTREFKKEEFLEKLSFKEIKEEMETGRGDELKEKMSELKELIGELEKMAQEVSTSTISTTSTTSTNHQ